VESHAHAILLAGGNLVYPRLITICGCRVRVIDWAPGVDATRFGTDVLCALATRPELKLRCWSIRGRGEDGERAVIAAAGRGARTLQDYLWR
jgi:hypothetical protein